MLPLEFGALEASGLAALIQQPHRVTFSNLLSAALQAPEIHYLRARKSPPPVSHECYDEKDTQLDVL